MKTLIEHDGRFLLVELGYKHTLWTIPGGGVKKRESFSEAVVRETQEEVGIFLQDPIEIGEYTNTKEFKKDTVKVFYSKVASPAFRVDGFEIIRAEWFSRSNLPHDMVSRFPVVLGMYDKYINKVQQILSQHAGQY